MRTLRFLLLLLVIGLLVPLAGFAQESTTPPPTTEPPAEEQQPEVVPIPELSSRLAAAQLRLREIEEASAAREDTDAILGEIEAFEETNTSRT